MRLKRAAHGRVVGSYGTREAETDGPVRALL
jgi:hypothetical protein